MSQRLNGSSPVQLLSAQVLLDALSLVLFYGITLLIGHLGVRGELARDYLPQAAVLMAVSIIPVLFFHYTLALLLRNGNQHLLTALILNTVCVVLYFAEPVPLLSLTRPSHPPPHAISVSCT